MADFQTENGIAYRDLNGNGRMDVYENPQAPIADRVEDLLKQMTLEEKAGLMFHSPVNAVGRGKINTRINWGQKNISQLICERHLSHFNIMGAPHVAELARWQNRAQEVAARTRLGIPVTFSSDPRHAAGFNPGAGVQQDGFSQWPAQAGLAAGSTQAECEQFADIAAREFQSTGIRMFLGPIADVASEPRWARAGATFGDRVDTVGKLSASLIRGLQNPHPETGAISVACAVKHFPGAGPQEKGLEPHFHAGRFQVYPGGHFYEHLRPFVRAFDAGAAVVMLSYGVAVGQTDEEVGVAFNRQIVTDLLRKKLGFDGIVLTDWMIMEDENLIAGLRMKNASAWGVEHLTVAQRYQKAIAAGVDQFGGQTDPSHVVGLVKAGLVPIERIDASVRRILKLKFQLGLFDNPFVGKHTQIDEDTARLFYKKGVAAQQRSVTLLTNKATPSGPTLPLGGRPKVYVRGVKAKLLAPFADVVRSPARADFAILNLKTARDFGFHRQILPYFFPHGRLDFPGRRLGKILKICETVPTIVAIHMDRPAVVPEIAKEAAALIATFGVADKVLINVIFGASPLTGRLPMDLPGSMAAVHAHAEDAPGFDNPLFPCGYRWEAGAEPVCTADRALFHCD